MSQGAPRAPRQSRRGQAGLFSADRAKALRERLALTQTELAALVGVHGVTVCRWEAGTMRPAPFQLGLLMFLDAHLKPSDAAFAAESLASRGATRTLASLLTLALARDTGVGL